MTSSEFLNIQKFKNIPLPAILFILLSLDFVMTTDLAAFSTLPRLAPAAMTDTLPASDINASPASSLAPPQPLSRLAQRRADYAFALQAASRSTLSPSAFLAAFPPETQPEELLRLRANLEGVVAAGFERAFDDVVVDMGLDGRGADMASGNRAIVEDVATECGIAERGPLDEAKKERIRGKILEVERLEEVARKFEEKRDVVREEVQELEERYTELSGEIATASEKTADGARQLSQLAA